MAAGEMEGGAIKLTVSLMLVFCCATVSAKNLHAHKEKLYRDGVAAAPIPVKDLPGRPLLVHNPMTTLYHHTQQRSETKLQTRTQDIPTDLEQNIEASGKSHYLVRVRHPAPSGAMEELQAASGDKDLQYVPHDTYIVAMEPHMKNRVEALQDVESVYHLPSGMKISPSLNELMASTRKMVPSSANDVFINRDPLHPEKRGNTHFRDKDPANHPTNRFQSAIQDKHVKKQTRGRSSAFTSGMNIATFCTGCDKRNRHPDAR